MAKNKNEIVDRSNMAVKSQQSVISDDAFANVILSWQAPDHIRYHKGWLWYSVAALINAALISFAVLSHSYTMLAVFLVLPLVYLLEQRKNPKIVDVIISNYGIKFGDRKMPYSEIQKFWVVHHPPYINEIHFLTNERMNREIIIYMLNIDPVLVRNYLVTQIREWEGKKEAFLDIIVRILKLA